MSMIEDVNTRLALIEATLTTERGETAKVATRIPDFISENDIPVFINMWGASSTKQREDKVIRITRDWNIHLVYAKAGEREDAKQQNRAAEWLSAWDTAMQKYMRLEDPATRSGLANVESAEQVGDNGGAIIAYPTGGKEHFYAVIFRMQIVYYEVCS